MATVTECEAALARLSRALGGLEPGKAASISARTVSCAVTDLNTVFSGWLDGAGFHDISTDPAAEAQIRLELTSDDLIALSNRELDFPKAWARGRVRVHASFGDLLSLRKFF